VQSIFCKRSKKHFEGLSVRLPRRVLSGPQADPDSNCVASRVCDGVDDKLFKLFKIPLTVVDPIYMHNARRDATVVCEVDIMDNIITNHFVVDNNTIARTRLRVLRFVCGIVEALQRITAMSIYFVTLAEDEVCSKSATKRGKRSFAYAYTSR